MLPASFKNRTKILILCVALTDWKACLAAPEPALWLPSIFGGKSLEPTGENLVQEIEQGNLESVKDLVDRGADVNYGSGIPLVFAAKGGHIEIVKYLLDSGANPNGDESLNYKGSVLASAAEYNQLDIIDLLIEAKASVTPEKYGRNILYRAARNGHVEAIRKLIQAGVDVNYSEGFSLLTAGEEGHVEVVKEFLNAGADVNIGKGWVLNTAARAGQTEVLKILIAAGAKKEYLDSSMLEAARNGHLETVKLLFDNGADPNYAGTLQAAATNGNINIVKLLLDAGAQITYDDTHKGFPLHNAASKGHIDVVNTLVAYGGDINRPLPADIWMDFIPGSEFYGDGWTVMHVIARFGYPYVKELLDLGADINAKDASGNTPLHIAVSFKKLKMAKEFLKFCIDASSVNNNGYTALTLAMNATKITTSYTKRHLKLMAVLQESMADRLAASWDNEKDIKALRVEFLSLVNTSSTLKEQLKNVTYGNSDVDSAIYYYYLEEAGRDLPKTIEDIYCKPYIQKEHRVSIGTEYLAKCECVPGEGPTMTYTPIPEGTKCQPLMPAEMDGQSHESVITSA